MRSHCCRLGVAGVVAVVLTACGSSGGSTGQRSSPTIAPLASGSAAAEAPRPAADYVALPKRRPAPGVLVLHPWWGLTSDVKTYADGLAAAGFVALAPDLYGDGSTASTVDAADALASAHDPAEMADRARIALAALLRRPDVAGGKAGVVGFSLGGQAASDLATGADARRVAALVLYYDASPDDAWDRLRGPVLVHEAQDDTYTAPADVTAMRQAITASGGRCQVIAYPQTAHWFAEPQRPQYRAAPAQAAAARTVSFLRQNLVL